MNALRRVAIGRKPWRGWGSDNGGDPSANLFSLIDTCQRLKVEPVDNLLYVRSRIAGFNHVEMPLRNTGSRSWMRARPGRAALVRMVQVRSSSFHKE